MKVLITVSCVVQAHAFATGRSLHVPNTAFVRPHAGSKPLPSSVSPPPAGTRLQSSIEDVFSAVERQEQLVQQPIDYTKPTNGSVVAAANDKPPFAGVMGNSLSVDKSLFPIVMGSVALAGVAVHHGALDALQSSAESLWQAYSHVLDSAPIPTKAVTSGTVYTIGDIIAQRTETKDGDVHFDAARTARSMLAGLCGHGILSHFWYNLSESFVAETLQWTAWWATIPKIALDQAFWGPFWNGVYILMLGTMKFDSPGRIFGDIKRSTVPLIISGLKLWPLAHVVTYGLLPTEHRLLWVDLVEIVWVIILATQANSLVEESGSNSATTIASKDADGHVGTGATQR